MLDACAWSSVLIGYLVDGPGGGPHAGQLPLSSSGPDGDPDMKVRAATAATQSLLIITINVLS